MTSFPKRWVIDISVNSTKQIPAQAELGRGTRHRLLCYRSGSLSTALPAALSPCSAPALAICGSGDFHRLIVVKS